MVIRRSILPAVCLLSFVGAQLLVPALQAQDATSPALAQDGKTKAATAAKAKKSDAEDEDYLELLKLFVDTFDQIDRNYVDSVDKRKLVEAAVRGMLTELDPYSSYISPQQLDRFRTGVESEFGGVGIQVQQDGEYLRIISPIYGTPAYAAGLMAGDVILKIGDESAQGITLDDAVRMMKGKIGTTVSMTIKGPGDEEPREVKLERQIIRVRTVLGDHRRENDVWDYYCDPDDKIGYIRLTSFGRHTVDELRTALGKLKDQGVRALVLDLRSNPGGLLTAAVEVCDLFLSQGKIVSTQGRSSPKRSWYAREPGTLPEFPMAILVNGYSASASEIVSACLQDHDRAVVIGQRTWGKGSVQNVVELEDGKSALKLTTAGYVRPSGSNIHRSPDDDEEDQWGVRPNLGFEIKLSDEELRELEAARRKRELIPRRLRSGENSNDSAPSEKPADPDAAKPTKADKPADGVKPAGDADDESTEFVDRQLQKAIEYLRERLGRAAGPTVVDTRESEAPSNNR